MERTVNWARGLAEAMLADEAPARWEHTQGVAQRVRDMRHRLGPEADLVEAAAWLHCIGYATEIAHTGFYPLDGARYLRDVHDAHNVVRELVAHHSGAMVQAQERGLDRELFEEFGPGDEHAFLLDALTAGARPYPLDSRERPPGHAAQRSAPAAVELSAGSG
jgi:HD superfamily phosphodiesterase